MTAPQTDYGNIPPPTGEIEFDLVEQIALCPDCEVGEMEYMDPWDVRDLCRALLRLQAECVSLSQERQQP